MAVPIYNDSDHILMKPRCCERQGRLLYGWHYGEVGMMKRASLAMIAAGGCIAVTGVLKGGFGTHETRLEHAFIVGGGLTFLVGVVLRFVCESLQPFS